MEGLGLQAVTLADGSTAYIQQSVNDGSVLEEGNTVQLEDGSTAFIQHITVQQKESVAFEDGQAVQLEDGSTAYIHHTPKDGYDPSAVEVVQLEDGSTAYIHHPSSLQTGGALETDVTGNFSTKTMTSEGENDENTENRNRAEQTNIQVMYEGKLWSSSKVQQVGEKTFHCGHTGCGRYYTTAHHLKVHERSHTGDRPYRCEFPSCTKAFATGYGLKSHLRTHTGEKPYKCAEDMCYKAFKTSGDLQKHLRTHTGEKPFKCPFEGCGRSFTTSNIRKVHTRTHTGERPYLCPEPSCGRAFASATNYKNHLRIHTGEKPYLCTVPGCGKSFTEYSSLYKHHVVHTHCKPYTCCHCGKTYRQTSTLAMHKRTAHGDFDTTEDEVFDGSLQPIEQKVNDAEVAMETSRILTSQVLSVSLSEVLVIFQCVTAKSPAGTQHSGRYGNPRRNHYRWAAARHHGYRWQRDAAGCHSNVRRHHDRGELISVPTGGVVGHRERHSDRSTVRRPADFRRSDYHGNSSDPAERTDLGSVKITEASECLSLCFLPAAVCVVIKISLYLLYVCHVTHHMVNFYQF